ncbi:MAG TPA: AraD1 family protein [Tepidisphaeraceae bacterium]|nr:AraD1 family protein [Tepidisphaeraceae bacterium]
MSRRLVQLRHSVHGRCAARVEEPRLRLLATYRSAYDAARAAIALRQPLQAIVDRDATGESLDYDAIYAGRSDWKLLPPFDHPAEPACCFVTGTGLTHKASAENRQSMHGDSSVITDSTKMYRIGLEGGRPKPGCAGAAPEWFYKGIGTILRAHGEPLDVPAHADDGGDEAEIAGCYIVADDGTPLRVGLVQGNEFSDHLLEQKNYLYLAQSKLRSCSIGPELIINADFTEVPGEARLERSGSCIWTGRQASGEKWMCHTLANLEHHHFKHAEHRRPGHAHVHSFGADLFSFKDRIRLEDGDEMIVAFDGFGRPLRNPIRLAREPQPFIEVRSL